METGWRYVFYVVAALTVVACATHQVDITPGVISEQQSVDFVQDLNFSADGLPVFSKSLRAKPHRVGESYFQVLYESSKPQAAFLVGVVGENKADWSRPFGTMFRWTNRGFEVGARFLEQTVNGVCTSEQRLWEYKDAFGNFLLCLAMGTVGFAVTTTGGFLIGTVASAPDFAQEFQRTIDPTRERLLIVMRMQYDTAGRLRSYTFELPDGRAGQQVVTGQCDYDGNSETPRECIVSSTPEKITRKTGYEL